MLNSDYRAHRSMISSKLSHTSEVRNAFRDASFDSESAFSSYVVDCVEFVDVDVEAIKG